ncbi:MAG: winged helix-turn-helix transcriptional regulator [Candidatus Hodarchaeales archaeon]|jgi:tetratricopeptide (TPR) repeat protein
MTKKAVKTTEQEEKYERKIADLYEKGFYDKIIEAFEEKNVSAGHRWYLLSSLMKLLRYDDLQQELKEWNLKDLKREEQAFKYYFQGCLKYVKHEIKEAEIIFSKGLTFTIDHPKILPRGLLLSGLALTSNQKGNYKRAIELINYALTIFDSFPSPLFTGRFLDTRGFINWGHGYLKEALSDFKESYTILSKLDNHFEMTFSLGHMGLVYRTTGNYNKATKYVKMAVDFAKETGSKEGLWSSFYGLALIKRDIGKLKEAKELLEKSLTYIQEINIPYTIAWTSIELGSVFGYLNDFQNASKYLSQAKELSLKMGHSRILAEAIYSDIRIREELGKNIAEDDLIQFPANIEENDILKGFYSMSKALIAQKENNWGMAEQLWTEALKIKGMGEFTTKIHESLTLIALKNYSNDGSSKLKSKLNERLEEFDIFSRKNNLIPSACKILVIRAKLASVEYNFKEAEKWIKKCLSMAREHGFPLHELLAKKEMENINLMKQKIKMAVDKETELFIDNQIQTVAEYLTRSSQIIDKLLISQRFQQEKNDLIQYSAFKLEKTVQFEKILEMLRSNPQGLLQKDLPKMANLSIATISRRINELVEQDIIERIPHGRSIKVRLK